ncbi:MAG: GNAT family N-acetyltransferase [Bradyrhizobiaceae bacterium]|nr:MAG: GNAT family N-acetyltransferase [Bradyrhizobiaceae bacterium]
MTLLEDSPRESYREACIPVLETTRLVLRAPHLGDAKAVAALANDRRIAENTARIPHPYRLADAEAFLLGSNREAGDTTFLVTLPDDTVIGACGFGSLDGNAPELGYWLGVPHWGRGYATEAARAVIDYAFTEAGREVLGAGARVTNPSSRRVIEKCGFQWTGVGLCRIRALGSSVPIDRFRLERSIWAALKSWGPVKRVA